MVFLKTFFMTWRCYIFINAINGLGTMDSERESMYGLQCYFDYVLYLSGLEKGSYYSYLIPT